jgi:uncharacterized protein
VNQSKAISLWNLAADQGFASAQFYLGCCYLNGEGVEVDLQKAVIFFRMAADQDHPGARNYLILILRCLNLILS